MKHTLPVVLLLLTLPTCGLLPPFGAATGAATGAVIGGPAGAATGAVLGHVAGAAAQESLESDPGQVLSVAGLSDAQVQALLAAKDADYLTYVKWGIILLLLFLFAPPPKEWPGILRKLRAKTQDAID